MQSHARVAAEGAAEDATQREARRVSTVLAHGAVWRAEVASCARHLCKQISGQCTKAHILGRTRQLSCIELALATLIVLAAGASAGGTRAPGDQWWRFVDMGTGGALDVIAPKDRLEGTGAA